MRLLDDHGIPRVSLWPRGVDSRRFSPTHRSESLRASWAPGRVIVGYMGRLAPEKEVDQLRALVDMPNVHLVVIGDGPSRRDLERALPSATFTGFLAGEQLSSAVASLDVMVHTGRHETFCQSVQEALASGVPVVAPGAGGPLDLVDPSRNGWLYEPGDSIDLRDRVRDLAGDDAKRRAMGAAARQSVLGRTWPSVMSQLEQHYADAVGAATLTTLEDAA